MNIKFLILSQFEVESVFEDILEADLEEASRPTRSAAQWRPMTGAYGVVNFEEFIM